MSNMHLLLKLAHWGSFSLKLNTTVRVDKLFIVHFLTSFLINQSAHFEEHVTLKRNTSIGDMIRWIWHILSHCFWITLSRCIHLPTGKSLQSAAVWFAVPWKLALQTFQNITCYFILYLRCHFPDRLKVYRDRTRSKNPRGVLSSASTVDH